MVPNSTNGRVKLPFVKLYVKIFLNPQNLLIFQCLGETSRSNIVLVCILNPLAFDSLFTKEWLLCLKKILKSLTWVKVMELMVDGTSAPYYFLFMLLLIPFLII